MPGSTGNPYSKSVAQTTAGFPPIIGEAPRVLVLGTLPSVKSVERQQYYGHPQNGFWKIMATLVNAHGDYAARQSALVDARIAVWDVLAASVRPGSMDADIDLTTARANPVAELVAAEPGMALVCFNGQKARALFDRFVGATRLREGVKLATLPSTSPAYAAMPLAEKTRRWAEALGTVLDLDYEYEEGKEP